MFYSFGQIQIPKADEKPGWYSLCADKEIANYYKWFYSKAFKTWNPPMNGCHVTFIAGEKDDRIITLDEIKPFLGKDIVFHYENEIWTNGRAFWLPVVAPELDFIREQLGLKPRMQFHVTLGNIK